MLTAFVVTLGISLAAESAEVESLLREGVKLRQAGQDQQAMQRFERAHALSESGRVLAQLGFAEQALGRWVDAQSHLEAALAKPLDTWVGSHRKVIDGALHAIAPRVARLEVVTSVAGAEVTVNGHPAGRTPLAAPVRVAAGSVALQVSAPGYFPVARSLEIPGETLARETVELTRRASPAGAEVAQRPSVALASLTAPASALTPPAAEVQIDPRPSGMGTLFWATAGAGTATLVGTVVAYAVAGHAGSRWDAMNCSPSALTSDCASARSTHDTGQTIGVIGLCATGVLAAIATYAGLANEP